MSRASPQDLTIIGVSLDWFMQAIASTRAKLLGGNALSAAAAPDIEARAVGAGLREAAAACTEDQPALRTRLLQAADVIDWLCDSQEPEGKSEPDPPPPAASKEKSPLAIELQEVIDSQRRQLFVAQAVARTVARLLRETYDFEVGEPDVAYALEAVDQILDDVAAALDPTALRLSRV